MPRRPPHHAHRPRVSAASALLLALATIVASACGSDSSPPFVQNGYDLSKALPAPYESHGSVRQVWLVNAAPSQSLELTDATGRVLQQASADDQGSLLLRDLAPGTYRVVSGGSAALVASDPLVVTDWENHPEAASYAEQQIGPGYGYLRTRDGTLLSINVYLPGPPENGPYPTVIEYSGYDPSNPEAKQPGTLIATTLGYAAVGVNIRGTGCSGGVFEFFEPLQSTDGYDVVETIAAQPWVKGHKVGMVGISYPGISQLFVAQLNPPSLAAITPLSVISDTGRGTLRPGGIFNDGFALEWARGRQNDAKPGGQKWSRKRLENGDQTCIDNMRLRGFTNDILETVEKNEYYVPAVADPLAPATFVDRIRMPVFFAGAWQDEQVGGWAANMIERFGVSNAHFSLTNGGHAESLNSLLMGRWIEFLRLYVDDTVPHAGGLERLLVNTVGDSVFGTPSPPFEGDRYAGVTSLEEARARFEADPRVRILFENGAGGPPGQTFPSFEKGFSAWPIPGTRATTWWLDRGGRLSDAEPVGAGADSFRYDPSRSQVTTLPDGGDGWDANPDWVWEAPPQGTALSYESDPLAETLVMAGTGSVDLWLSSTAQDTDLQVTLSEVRPDGNETYVQSGWLRASVRAIDESQSTELRPVFDGREETVAPLPSGEPALARVQIFPFAHVFRAGSRVRIVVAAPGGDRIRWTFDALPAQPNQVNTVERSAARPSRVVLPVIPGVDGVPAGLPACPSLKGQPCRAYAPIANGEAA